ncbi:MAG TPA: NAD(P)H-binding protein [Chitinophagaceae bacterium]|nr:NAD(P)H-binding protein [Chitinophagaceae bacterium]
MQTRTATIIGATGLIGSHLLDQLVQDDSISQVKIIVRRPVTVSHAKARVVQIDFSDQVAFKQAIEGSDMVFCAVGTTQHKVKGDKAAYRKVDYDIPVTAAKFCAATGVEEFLLVSSVGANSRSRNFYLKLKGEVEDAVRQVNIASIAIFRPSMLLGNRQEVRQGERMAQAVMKALAFVIPARYKPIEAGDVARAMIAAAKQQIRGVKVYHYGEIRELAASAENVR